jgi:hypothetical protein
MIKIDDMTKYNIWRRHHYQPIGVVTMETYHTNVNFFKSTFSIFEKTNTLSCSNTVLEWNWWDPVYSKTPSVGREDGWSDISKISIVAVVITIIYIKYGIMYKLKKSHL